MHIPDVFVNESRMYDTTMCATSKLRLPVFHRLGLYFAANLAEAGNELVFWASLCAPVVMATRCALESI